MVNALPAGNRLHSKFISGQIHSIITRGLGMLTLEEGVVTDRARIVSFE